MVERLTREVQAAPVENGEINGNTAVIYTIPAGGGHMSAATAYQTLLSELGYSTKILVPTTLPAKLYHRIVTASGIYSSLFHFSNHPAIARILIEPTSQQAKIHALRHIPSFTPPDLAISTHPLIHPRSGSLKVMIIPDPEAHAAYCASPQDIDYCFLFWPEAVLQATEFNIPPEKVKVTGPLVRPAFYRTGEELRQGKTKADFKQQLDIDPEKELILVTAGGGWIDRSRPYLDLLATTFAHQDIQFAFVCGRNREFIQNMSFQYPQFRFLGWQEADEMATWMAASDSILALTLAQMSAEAGLVQTPIFILGLIQGQEEGYRKVVEDRGVGRFLEGSPSVQIATFNSLLPQTEALFGQNLKNWQEQLLAVPQTTRDILEEITAPSPSL